MTTNRTSDIARAISERYDISAREATNFLNAMVSIINEALQYEKQIKIKGLGTFKLTSVSARESIDVTTGERISIEGREKISFSPDATLRDRVNAPFAQFETFVINEGVDFSEIDARSDTMKEKAGEADDLPSEMITQQETQAEQVAQQATPVVIVSDQEPSIEVAQEPVVDTETVSAPAYVPVVEEVEATVETVEEQKPVVADPVVEEMISTEKTPKESINELNTLQQLVADLREGKEEAEDHLNSIRRRLYWMVASTALLLLLIGGGVFYTLHQLNQRDQLIHELLAANLERAQQQEQIAVEADTLQASSSVGEADEGQKAEQAAGEAAEPQGDSVQNVKDEKTEEADEKSEEAVSEHNYDSDPRIRLGAYRIVGIDRQVTVVRGQTFKMISKAHLGEGMECYIEAVNPGVTSVKEGDVLNIPKLELKKK